MMPPKIRITEDMIVDAAFSLARTQGADKITAQAVAKELGCSTQPIMSHFQKVEDLRTAVAQKADAFHSGFLMDIQGENPMLEIGMNYIRFAKEEPHLFRLLFQSGALSGTSLWDSLEAEEMQPMLEILSKEADFSIEDAKQAFRALVLVVHGYASFFAANNMEYNREEIEADLSLIFEGTLCSLKERNEHA